MNHLNIFVNNKSIPFDMVLLNQDVINKTKVYLVEH